MGGEGERTAQEGGPCEYFQLIHTVQQKPTQYWKAIILQLKIQIKKEQRLRRVGGYGL